MDGLMQFQFLVQGSAEDPYTVTFRRTGNGITGHCTCPAGKARMHCKHRVTILGGGVRGIVSGNAHEAALVAAWLPGSALEAALARFHAAGTAAAAARRELTQATAALAAALHG